MLMSVLPEDVAQPAPHVAEPKPEPKVSPATKVEPEPKRAPIKKPESPPTKGIYIMCCVEDLFSSLMHLSFVCGIVCVSVSNIFK